MSESTRFHPAFKHGEQQRERWRTGKERSRRKETKEQYQQRLSKQRERSARNCGNESDEQKQRRRERNRECKRKRLQNETPEQRKKRLLSMRAYNEEYFDKMSDDKYDELCAKHATHMRNKRKGEPKDKRQVRLYNMRLRYTRSISQLSDSEVQQMRTEARERTANWRRNASKEEKELQKEQNRENMRFRRDYYAQEASKRQQRRARFEEAKHYKLLPADSHLTTDTGHEPFVSYLIKKKLMYNHDPMCHVPSEMCHFPSEMMSAVRRRDVRIRWGEMIYPLLTALEIRLRKVKDLDEKLRRLLNNKREPDDSIYLNFKDTLNDVFSVQSHEHKITGNSRKLKRLDTKRRGFTARTKKSKIAEFKADIGRVFNIFPGIVQPLPATTEVEQNDVPADGTSRQEEAQLLNEALNTFNQMYYSVQPNKTADNSADKSTDNSADPATLLKQEFSKGNNLQKQTTKMHNKIPVRIIYSDMCHGPAGHSTQSNPSNELLRALTDTEKQSLQEQGDSSQEQFPPQRNYFRCSFCQEEFACGDLYSSHVIKEHYLASIGSFWNQKCFQKRS